MAQIHKVMEQPGPIERAMEGKSKFEIRNMTASIRKIVNIQKFSILKARQRGEGFRNDMSRLSKADKKLLKGGRKAMMRAGIPVSKRLGSQ